MNSKFSNIFEVESKLEQEKKQHQNAIESHKKASQASEAQLAELNAKLADAISQRLTSSESAET